MISKVEIFVLLFLLSASPLHAQTAVSRGLAGHWSGVSGSAKIAQGATIGAGFAKKDIGHRIESFEFDIDGNGRVTGHGIAVYWFNVSAAIPMIAANAHLDGNVRRIEFSIDGNVTEKGVFITSKAMEKLPLVSPGKRQIIDAWNVFGPEPAKLDNGLDGLFLGSSATNSQLEMTVEWKARKDEGKLTVYDINTPSPDNSFISTDEIGFRAKVTWAEQLNDRISWKGEDCREDNIDSGRLNPAGIQNSPYYSAKPNSPAAPNGRGGKLSYRVTASVDADITEKEDMVIIAQDELDQLRQEYVDMNKTRVPQRDEFTHDNGQFNTGDYGWVIVKQEALDGYNTIVQAFAPNVANMNSAYRNPVHNAKLPGSASESRHIYGDALDLQTPSIGHSGPPTYEDWLKLKEATKTANPSFIEEYNQSGVGHVHVDWRP